jgi:hypothetical protein
MPRMTEKGTDEYRLWETIYLQKGEMYLSEKLKYFQGKVQEEEIAFLGDVKEPASEYKDSFFYEQQIAQYQESIKIITSIIRSNSKKRIFSHTNLQNMAAKWFCSHFSVFKKLFLNSPKNKEKEIIYKSDATHDIPIDEKKILEQRNTNVKIKNKVKLNMSGIVMVFALLLLTGFISYVYKNMVVTIITSVLIISLLPRFIFLLKQRNNKIIDSKERYYLKMLANKLNSELSGNVIRGYLNDHRVEINYDNHPHEHSVVIALSARMVKNLLIYFTTKNIQIQGLTKIIIEGKDVGKIFNVYSNQDRIKFIIDEKVRFLLLDLYRIDKQFEFITHDDKIYYYDFNPKISSEKTILIYIKIIILFNELSNRLESL